MTDLLILFELTMDKFRIFCRHCCGKQVMKLFKNFHFIVPFNCRAHRHHGLDVLVCSISMTIELILFKITFGTNLCT